MVWGLGFRGGSGFRVYGLGCGSGALRLRVSALTNHCFWNFRFSCFVSRVQGFLFLGLRVRQVGFP